MTYTHSSTPAPISSADIVITDAMLNPRPEVTILETDADTPDETAAIFCRLRRIKASYGWKPNKDELATALIKTCIQERIDKWYRIRGALRVLGIKPHHATGILNAGTGDDPTRHLWWIDEDDSYRLHSPSL